MHNLISKNFYELTYYNMKEFNMKQWLVESKSGMYSKSPLNENALLDAETLGVEIAKAHPELLRFRHDGETRKLQDAIFKYAGEMLHSVGIPLQTVRGLAYDADWAMELVSATNQALENSNLEEVDPAALGTAQDAADARFNQEDESQSNLMEAAYGNVGSVDKVAPAETGLNKYLDLIQHHDWFHHFSDDQRAWRRGQAEKDMMKALYAQLNPAERQKAMDAFVDKYLELHDPKQFPNAANNVKYLTTDTFKGAI